MAAAFRFTGVAGMLVLFADRLDEADRLERAVLRRLDELRLILQVRGARRVVGVVVERLMVILEVLVWAAQRPLIVGVGIRAG
jgi:hypothetical protein